MRDCQDRHMSDTAIDDPQGAVSATRSRLPSERVVAITIAILFLLAAVGAGIWHLVAQSALAGVRVTYDAEPVRCQGAEVGVFPDLVPDGEYPDDYPWELYFDDQFRTPLVNVAPGMTCALRIQVINDGWADATVSRIDLRFFGEIAGLAVAPVLVNPNGVGPHDTPDGSNIDASFDIEGGIPVPSGATQTFTAVFEYRQNPAMGECGATTVNVPVVTFDSMGQARSASPSDDQAISFRKPSPNGCD